MDHPIGHNEMSSLMDVYSEIYILEQFKEDPNVCSLYDYGVNKDSVFMVMKDYKCSLLVRITLLLYLVLNYCCES